MQGNQMVGLFEEIGFVVSEIALATPSTWPKRTSTRDSTRQLI